MGGHDDLALVARARVGDPDAWEVLYRRAYPALITYARFRVGQGEQAEDAVSEAMARAMAAIERYRPGPVGLEGWLVGILRNVVHEGHRRSGRTVLGEVAERADTDPGPFDRVVAEEEHVALRRALAQLDPGDQELLVLRLVVGLDAEAVGAIVGKRAGAVRMAQSRAVARLRDKLGEVDR